MGTSIELLLLNVLFLVVFLLFIPSFVETYPKDFSSRQKNSIFLICASLASITCMLFPFQINDGTIIDLRWVPVIIIGLYIGVPASAVIVVLIVAFRFFQSGLGVGVYSSLIVGIILLIILSTIFAIFKNNSRTQKIIIGCTFSTFTTVFIKYYEKLY